MAAVTYTLPFAPGKFIEYLLNRPDVVSAWKLHTEHVFLNRLTDGNLPLEAFKYYLVQDYLYLIQFARANSLAGFKAKRLEDTVRSAEIFLHINREMSLHLGYCAEFGLSKEDMLNTEESQACTVYTRFVLDTGSSDDWLALHLALAPCLIGYRFIAKRLHADPKTLREGNPYWRWIENYAAEDYSEAVELGIGTRIEASRLGEIDADLPSLAGQTRTEDFSITHRRIGEDLHPRDKNGGRILGHGLCKDLN
jgi:hydroxymethylpyrimidine/phosphomethylpyrimidine kinase / thiaminase